MMRAYSILFATFFALAFSDIEACPTVCNCFGWVGENVVDCARKGLTTIPFADFPANTTEIHLQYNDITTLDVLAFANVPILKHLYLQSNKIEVIPDGIFGNVSELLTLRINDNRIADLGYNTFSNLKKLLLLYAHNNRLESLHQSAFLGMDAVQQISVAGNPNLKEIHSKAFNNNLTMIDISGSSVPSISPLLFTPGRDSLQKVYMYNIKSLVCDSTIIPLLQWMNLNPLTAFGRSTMICAEPENLRGKSLLVVNEEHIVRSGSCPTECACFNDIVDCSSRGLTSIPVGFAPETTEIFLQNNNITRLGNNNFIHLSKLEFLYLHDNQIDFWDINAFSGVAPTLRQLTLNNNLLPDVPIGVFTGMRSLEVLNLNGNQIRLIRPDEFSDLTSLVQLSILNNQLTVLPANSFTNLVSLKYLGLANNQLSSIPDDLLSNSEQLYFFDFSGNELDAMPAIPSGVTRIVARNSGLKSLTVSAFQKAAQLQILDVAKNTIYVIEKDAFSGASNLLQMDLSYNTMEEVNSITFASASKLQVLDLSYNDRLETVTEDAFIAQRKSLLRLYLDNSKLSTMSGKTLSVMEDSGFLSTISGNPWNCDCNLENLAEFIKSAPSSIYDEDDAKCIEPKQEVGKPLHEVDYETNCIVQVPKDESKALVMSLSIVGAVLVFGIVTGLILWQSNKKSKRAVANIQSQGGNGDSNNVYVKVEGGAGPSNNGKVEEAESHKNHAYDPDSDREEAAGKLTSL